MSYASFEFLSSILCHKLYSKVAASSYLPKRLKQSAFIVIIFFFDAYGRRCTPRSIVTVRFCSSKITSRLCSYKPLLLQIPASFSKKAPDFFSILINCLSISLSISLFFFMSSILFIVFSSSSLLSSSSGRESLIFCSNRLSTICSSSPYPLKRKSSILPKSFAKSKIPKSEKSYVPFNSNVSSRASLNSFVTNTSPGRVIGSMRAVVSTFFPITLSFFNILSKNLYTSP
ncbi:hypothetical protein bcere0022_49670 [Bacillus cereus Rock3-44]|nr:hypothetical protein bcere0022_49670 [Bacillus cereus Rock3-44]